MECSLDLDTGHVEELREDPQTTAAVFCSCTGACKTNRCLCKKLSQGCTAGKCRCKPSKCCRQKEEPAVDIGVLGEANSSDSEPEDFCICRDECSTTLCYCLAIKQVPCSAQCKCDESHCKNRTDTAEDDVEPPLPTHSPSTTEDVKQFCATKSRGELEEVLIAMASRCPQLWNSISKTGSTQVPTKPHLPPSWCKCGKCHPEPDPEDQICCKNKSKNHENPHFFQLCLDQQTLELALINNCDWLNMPRIYTNSKFRNTAYRQYILWFYGKLGYQKRKRIPSCIKWSIRNLYPEVSGQYVGYHEAL